MRKWLVISLIMMSAIVANGQDIHLSQYYHSPLLTNPALTGNYEGTMRFVANQRQQWRSVTTPYQTFAVSAETNRIKDKQLNLGLSIMNDKAGDSHLNTFQMLVSSAFAFSLNPDSTAIIRLGAQTGFTQKKIDFSELRFDDQYNGYAYDPSLPHFENTNRLKESIVNFNLGIDFDKKIDHHRSYGFGVSVFNLMNSSYTYLGDNTSQLEKRLSTQFHAQREIAKDWDAIFSAQMMWQGEYQEKIAGMMFKRIWHDNKLMKRAGYIGGFLRPGDSGYVLLAMDYDDWKFGLSYDINYSPLNVASRYRGGLELSVIYILDIFNETIKPHRACPDFI